MKRSCFVSICNSLYYNNQSVFDTGFTPNTAADQGAAGPADKFLLSQPRGDRADAPRGGARFIGPRKGEGGVAQNGRGPDMDMGMCPKILCGKWAYRR